MIEIEQEWTPDEALGELCKRSLSRFVKELWDTVVPNPLVWEPHMDVLCSEIQESDERVFLRKPKLHDIIINVPPGTTKTMIISVLSTCWEFACMPSLRVFVGSYSDSAAMGIADNISIVMNSDKYKRMFPKTRIRRNKSSPSNFKTTDNGEFYAFTVGGTLTSKHADILKVDDPLNPKQAASEADLATCLFFFDRTLPTRKVDKDVTPLYLVMQRLSTKDPSGHLLEKKGDKVRHICLPGELSKRVSPPEYKMIYSNGLLSPVRLSRKVLTELRGDLGEEGYAGQIDQNPVPEGGLIWKKWFLEIPDHMFPEPSSFEHYGTDWDLAYTEDEKNAASAFITSGKIKGDIYIDRLGYARHEFPALVAWMKTKPAPHYIEAKASGKSAKQTLVNHGVNAIEVAVAGASDKVARAKMATPTAESGRVYIRKSQADMLYNDTNQGILYFPRGKYKDLADTLSQVILRQDGQSTISSSASDDDVLDFIN